jgi:hypothetical protein
MALHAGERLGPYEILGGLGAGGMGEVYRARDQRLGRAVAIKVLPAEAAGDPERLRRFDHEARASSSLSHPNILGVLDVGTHDGAPYLVAELLEGETLRQRLENGALAVRKAVEVAVQVARGLAAAHEHGIVHRDLKPENLFLTRDGILKILDFGLARLEKRASDDESTTTAAGGTDAGVVMGTVGYMSPEQVRGETADHRSDVFALGAVLYEMLTGSRAFRRGTSVETLSAILKEEPPEFAADKRVPPALDRVIRRCLEKKPQDRFQSACDLVFALEVLSEAPATHGAPAPRRDIRTAKSWRWLLLAGLGVLAVAAAAAGLIVGRRTAPVGLKFQILTFRRGTVWSARFSADGQTIVYGATWDGQPIRLFTTRPGSTESRPLDLPDADVLSISRNNELALALGRSRRGFVGTSAGTLARTPLAGGTPRALLDDVKGADWSPEGRDLAVARIAADGERLEYPVGTVLTQDRRVLLPRVSPKGDLVAFVTGDTGADIAVVSRSGEMTTLVQGVKRGVNSLMWSRGGDEIWFGASMRGDEWAIYGVDLRGRLRTVMESPFVCHVQDVLRDGRVLVTVHDDRGELFAKAPGDAEERNVSWLDFSIGADLSPDGRRLLFREVGHGGAGRGYPFCLRRTDDAAGAVLVDDATQFEWTVESLSPSGKWLLRNGPAPVGTRRELRLIPTGSGEPKAIQAQGIEVLQESPGAWRSQFVLLDEARVIFYGQEPGRAARSWLVDVVGGRPRPVTPEGQAVEAVSPDGAWAVARDAERRLLLYPVGGGAPRSAGGPPEAGAIRTWSSDGRALFVSEPHDVDGLGARMFRRDLATGRRDLWSQVRPADQSGLAYVGRMMISADGSAYSYTQIRCLSSLYLVEGLR